MSAGLQCSAFILSDGQAIVFDDDGFLEIPDLEEGVQYVQASAGDYRSAVLLRSDGQAVVVGSKGGSYFDSVGIIRDIAEPEEGVEYIQVSKATGHTALLRSDGRVVSFGDSKSEERFRRVPDLEEGVGYVQVSTEIFHTVLLRSDGQAVVVGGSEELLIPELEEGIEYVQVSAGASHVCLLRSDGRAIAVGANNYGQCNIPELEVGVAYEQVSAGTLTTALLRSDGRAVAVGNNRNGKCNIPLPEPGIKYVQVSAGSGHMVLLRSDGSAVQCGPVKVDIPALCGQRSMFQWIRGKPCLPAGVTYVTDQAERKIIHQTPLVVQLFVVGTQADELVFSCKDISGELLKCLTLPKALCAPDLQERLATALDVRPRMLSILLHDGRRLEKCARTTSIEELLVDDVAA